MNVEYDDTCNIQISEYSNIVHNMNKIIEHDYTCNIFRIFKNSLQYEVQTKQYFQDIQKYFKYEARQSNIFRILKKCEV